jgi:uncharacterized protein with NRDE domain
VCLILFAYRASTEWPLVIASNRDEAYERPTQEAQFWSDAPHILAGRDLDKGGTWLGIDKEGRFGVLTNFREGSQPVDEAPRSRGKLVESYLRQNLNAHPYLENVISERTQYAGFSMLLGDLKNLYFYSNRMDTISAVEPGVHGLSNALLDDPWPKVERGRGELSTLLLRPSALSADLLFEMLQDPTTYERGLLPQTGIDAERERILSAKFIAVDEHYGTRSSTVIMVHSSGQVHYEERNFKPYGVSDKTSTFDFQLPWS